MHVQPCTLLHRRLGILLVTHLCGAIKAGAPKLMRLRTGVHAEVYFRQNNRIQPDVSGIWLFTGTPLYWHTAYKCLSTFQLVMCDHVRAGQHPDMPSRRLPPGEHAGSRAPGPPDLLCGAQRQCGAAPLCLGSPIGDTTPLFIVCTVQLHIVLACMCAATCACHKSIQAMGLLTGCHLTSLTPCTEGKSRYMMISACAGMSRKCANAC